MIRRMGTGAVVVTACMIVGAAWAAGPAGEVPGGGAPAPFTAEGQAYALVDDALGDRVLPGRIDRMIDRVVALNEAHGWAWSATGALIARLEEALIDLDDRRFDDAARQLGGFRDRVEAHLEAGALTPDTGAPLLAGVADVLARVKALARAERLADGPVGPPARN